MRFQLPLFDSQQKREETGWLKSLPLEIKRRAYQKTITLRVYPNATVRVSCSKTCPVFEINKFLMTNRNWIEKSLAEARLMQNRFPPKTFVQGEEFLFLGKRLPLIHLATPSQRPKMFFKDGKLFLNLHKGVYQAASTDSYQKAMLSFYKTTGSALLSEIVKAEADKMSLHPSKVSFRSQKSRWGSCSSQGNISLNWRLVCAPTRVAKYVVVHELAHLKHQDHSPRFWGLVESHMPEYKACKRWLNENQREFDFLSV